MTCRMGPPYTRSISVSAAPAGTMGYTHSFLVDQKIHEDRLGNGEAWRMTGSTSSGLVALSPRLRKPRQLHEIGDDLEDRLVVRCS